MTWAVQCRYWVGVYEIRQTKVGDNKLFGSLPQSLGFLNPKSFHFQSAVQPTC